MTDTLIYFLFFLFVISFLYSSVGHGGASGYITLMLLFSFPVSQIRINALILNMFVSGVAFVWFYIKQRVSMRLIITLLSSSIPLSFIGGMLFVDIKVLKIILSFFLLIVILRLLDLLPKAKAINTNPKILFTMLLGSSIGFLSGLIGIGGGIILTPILIFLNWASVKESATISSIFIFVNSFSGLMGNAFKGFVIQKNLWFFVITVSLGAVVGAYYGSIRFNTEKLKKILALILFIACFKLWLV